MNFLSLLDLGIVIPTFGLMGISLSLIASTTSDLFTQQLIFFLAGFAAYIFFASLDFRIYPKFKWIFYFFSLILLVVTFFSPQVRGSHRWLDFGLSRFQPSEIIKPFLIVIFAACASTDKQANILPVGKRFFLFLPMMLLIFRQPDLGNVLVFLFTFIAIEIMNGLPWKYLTFMSIVLGALGPLLWIMLKEYQRSRLISFLNPEMDPAGTGYNALQAMIALGSGGISGLGLGRGTQSHLLFLPEYHTDFVFASLGEELGLIGGIIVIFFYFVLLGKILLTAVSTENVFGRLLCIGIFMQLFIQVFINIGMNLGLLPITGITLPLVSYGGSSVISTMIGLGMIMSVARISKSRKPIVIG